MNQLSILILPAALAAFVHNTVAAQASHRLQSVVRYELYQ